MTRAAGKTRIVMKFGGTSVGRRRAHPAVSPRGSSARSTPATRSPSSSRPWPAPPTSSSAGPTPSRRLHDAREYDAVVATGEQVTAGLLAIALQEIGVEARSWLGWQIPIRTDDAHGKARIAAIDDGELDPRAWPTGEVAVVAGFQGIGAGQPHHHARPRRLRHLGGGAGGGAEGRSLRHLHRRRRRLHDRPAHRCQGAQAR